MTPHVIEKLDAHAVIRYRPIVNSPSPAVQQPLLPLFFLHPVVIPQGEDTFLVKPGKPVATLTIAEAARELRVHRDTVYRLYHTGVLKGERPSRGSIRIYAASLQEHRRATSDPELWDLQRG